MAWRSLPRIVFADMDDTFLDTDKHVPAANRELLDVLTQHDVPFVPCTGRPVSAVPDEVLAHPATRFAIGANGSVVHDVCANRRLHVVGMDKRMVVSLYERVREMQTTFDVFADGEVYSERARYEAMGSFGIDAPSLEMLRRVRIPVDLSVPQIVERVCVIEKVTCFWRTPHDRDLLREAIDAEQGICSASGHPQNFELQAAGVSKGFALGWLCEHLGIDLADAVAFGDAENDVSMLEVAGDGVAVANAIPHVLAVADHVTLDCNHAGVASYLL
jgi:hypothetical protein